MDDAKILGNNVAQEKHCLIINSSCFSQKRKKNVPNSPYSLALPYNFEPPYLMVG